MNIEDLNLELTMHLNMGNKHIAEYKDHRVDVTMCTQTRYENDEVAKNGHSVRYWIGTEVYKTKKAFKKALESINLPENETERI